MNPTNNLSEPHEAPDIVLNDWLQAQADELESLVAPFRASRSRGHESLLCLLEDPQTRADVVGQIACLSSFLNQLHPLYLESHAIAERWRQQYESAPAAEQPALQLLHDPRRAARLLDALQLLNNEVVADLLLFRKWAPESFAPTSVNNRI